MKTRGGGWTVIQHRRNGSVDFHRGWRDYKTVGSPCQMAGPLLSSGLMVSVLQDWTGGFNNFPRVLWHREVRESSSPVIPGDLRLLYLAALMFSTAPPMLLHLLSLPVPAILPHIHINKNAQTHTRSRVTQHYYLHPSSDSPKPSCAGIWVRWWKKPNFQMQRPP